jgi:hypothetical protein
MQTGKTPGWLALGPIPKFCGTNHRKGSALFFLSASLAVFLVKLGA